MRSTDTAKIEDDIKLTFNLRFTKHPDGGEYFTGDRGEMVKAMMNIVHDYAKNGLSERESSHASIVDEAPSLSEKGDSLA